MKTLVLGAPSRIGKYISNKNDLLTYNNNKIKNGIKFDITKNDIKKILNKYEITSVVFLSAISDPDECITKKKYANLVNLVNAKKIIDELIKRNIYFIFFSSEYIFSGVKGNYTEKSVVKSNNLYGKQKFLIEKFIKKKTKNYAIFRIARTYGDKLNDNTLITNFLSELMKGKKEFSFASDQKFNPLYAYDLKKIINRFILKNIRGTFNVGGNQKFSRFECINIILKSLNYKNRKKIKLNKTSFSNFKTIDNRPFNTTFNINKLKKKVNIKMTDFEKVVKKIIKKYEINNKIF